MAGKKRTPDRPQWFKPRAYDVAESLDAGDWLLNLTLRGWLRDTASSATEDALRHVGPVLKRGDAAQVRAMHLADVHRWVYSFNSDDWPDPFEAFDEASKRPSLPGDVFYALQRGQIRSSIAPLGVTELYVFERMLPDEIRVAGASFKPGDNAGRYPWAFSGRLDDAFGPGPEHQRTSRFVRIDLALPDDVLHADLKRYLVSERRRLASMGGVQPYREAASIKLKAHELRTLAADGLLQFLDLDRWQRAEGMGLSFYAVREMADIDRSREDSLRHRVALVQSQMKLHAWFARLERSAKVLPKRRGKSQ
jgi:hypothetical protein